MRLPWHRNHHPAEPPATGPPPGDPEGVARAERELARSERRLAADREHVIEPLRREAYRNNIQGLVHELLRPRDGGNRGHSASPG